MYTLHHIEIRHRAKPNGGGKIVIHVLVEKEYEDFDLLIHDARLYVDDPKAYITHTDWKFAKPVELFI